MLVRISRKASKTVDNMVAITATGAGRRQTHKEYVTYHDTLWLDFLEEVAA